MRKTLLLTATTALVACAGGTASASAASFSASSLVQFENGNCGKYVSGKPINGSAHFIRTANKLKVTYSAKKLAKLTTYHLQFFNANPCEFLGSPATFLTTSTGVGKVTAEMEIPEGDVEFFVDGSDEGAAAPFTNDSFTVVLPKP
jgi:hypothetical protein